MNNRSKPALFATVLCVVAAVYTKYNAVFFSLLVAVCVIHVHGWRAIRDGAALRAAVLGGVLLLPIAAIFIAFAGYDLEQAAAMPTSPARLTIEGVTYYSRIMPAVLSTEVSFCGYRCVRGRRPGAHADHVHLTLRDGCAPGSPSGRADPAPETNVGFWGALDGTYVYAMRAYSGPSDLGIVRLDKLLFSNLQVYFEHGYSQNVMQPEEITDLLAKLHTQYVMQTGFHDDVAAVKMLAAALGSDKFSEVARIPMNANYRDTIIVELIIYRANEEVPRGRVSPAMQIKLLGRSL